MTVTTDKTKDKVQGNGTVGPYSFSGIKLINPKTDLMVYIEDANGDIGMALTVDVDYSISYSETESSASFDITMIDPLNTIPNTEAVFVNRTVPLLQNTKLSRSGEINTERYESMVDRTVLQNQDQNSIIKQSFRLKENVVDDINLELGTTVGNEGKAVIVNATGDGLTYSDVDLSDLDADIQRAEDAATAAEASELAASNSATTASNAATTATNEANRAQGYADSIDPSRIDSNEEAIAINLPINDTIYYGGEFDASTQYTQGNSPTYTYNGEYYFDLNGTNQYLLTDVNIGSKSTFKVYADFVMDNATKFIVFGNSVGAAGLQLEINTQLSSYLSSNNSTYDISNGDTGTKTYVVGNKYQIEYEKTPTQHIFSYRESTDNGATWSAWTTDITVNSSTALWAGTVIQYGADTNGTTYYADGKFYLTGMYAIVEDELLLRSQDVAYEPNTIMWKGTARSDDNTTNIVASDYIQSPTISGETAYSKRYLFVGLDNSSNTVLEFDTDIDGTNLSTITGVKRRIGDKKNIQFLTDGSGDLSYFEKAFDTWYFDLWVGSLSATGSLTLSDNIVNYKEIDFTATSFYGVTNHRAIVNTYKDTNTSRQYYFSENNSGTNYDIASYLSTSNEITTTTHRGGSIIEKVRGIK